MTTQVTFRPGTQIVDPRSGLLTREGNQIIAAILSFYQGTQSAAVTTDGIETLTNKTMDGDANTFTDINTSSLKTKTGNSGRVVTGNAGTAGDLAQWDGAGNVGDGPNLSAVLGGYLPITQVANGTVATTVTSLGPTGSSTTIVGWLTFDDPTSPGTTRYIPYY